MLDSALAAAHARVLAEVYTLTDLGFDATSPMVWLP